MCKRPTPNTHYSGYTSENARDNTMWSSASKKKHYGIKLRPTALYSGQYGSLRQPHISGKRIIFPKIFSISAMNNVDWLYMSAVVRVSCIEHSIFHMLRIRHQPHFAAARFGSIPLVLWRLSSRLPRSLSNSSINAFADADSRHFIFASAASFRARPNTVKYSPSPRM